MSNIRLSREVVERHARRSGDTSNRLISARTGIHEATLSHLFSGRRSPSLEVALLISNAYGTTVNELLQNAA
ncbi:helix-turn-helix domain-containing protein [Kitasatospora kifunensis]|uniref:Transcriptional regulator with XRE-family HTH domain n=1 Tax=Kitasatospora kifunensis TaxID=58351 RepID=A0A7W7QZ69_KITKI|nr:helix-turn-helix transcriptional regulator [Kitasatospora kifunensis]MBB4922223.1 transcriptional regulator with XRE-family HTH domain [Kitasatospora kifunensis]